MAATIKKLLLQGHKVYIAYMTSGCHAVFDHDAKKYLDFFRELAI
jgi:glucosamine-6-phosphate deaminase